MNGPAHAGHDVDVFFEAVNGGNVRMIQRRQDLRFAFEPRQPVGVERKGVWEDLERDLAVQPGIARAVDLTHPADAQSTGDFVRAKASAWSQRHMNGGLTACRFCHIGTGTSVQFLQPNCVGQLLLRGRPSRSWTLTSARPATFEGPR